MPYPEPLPLWQSTADLYLHRRHSYTVLSQSLWGLWVLVRTKFVWALRVSLAGMGLDSKHNFTPPTILLGLFFALGCGVSFFLVGSNILLWRVVQQWVVILKFLQEKMSARPSTLPSWNATLNNYDNFFMITVLKSISDNSYIYVILELILVDFFFHPSWSFSGSLYV